jgi:hypothetical protein
MWMFNWFEISRFPFPVIINSAISSSLLDKMLKGLIAVLLSPISTIFVATSAGIYFPVSRTEVTAATICSSLHNLLI